MFLDSGPAASRRPGMTEAARPSFPIEHFDGQDRRQMPRDLLPVVAFIDAGEHRAAVGAEIDSSRFALVTGHRLAEHREETALLRQTLTHRLPALAAVAGAPHRRR